jgi:hypothetical protein
MSILAQIHPHVYRVLLVNIHVHVNVQAYQIRLKKKCTNLS